MGKLKRPGMGKWIAGIAAAVVGGVLVWWLTSLGGPLDPQSPKVRFDALGAQSVALVGSTPSAMASVENSGDATATGCQILWSPFTDNPADTPYPASIDFSLAAGESRQMGLGTNRTYTDTGPVEMAAQLVCDDTKSAVATQTVTVR